MSTAQGGLVSSALYVIVYVASLRAVSRQVGGGVYRRRPRPAAVVLWLVVAVPSLLQVVWPQVFVLLSRQPDLVRRGQWWRVLTSVLVQDGGPVGTAYNLVTLALSAVAATTLWRAGWVVAVFVAGALAFDVPAVFLWPEAGGGNSGATFFLATFMVGLLLVRVRTRSAGSSALVVTVCGTALLLLRDAHGEAVLLGLALGALTAIVSRTSPAVPAHGAR